MYLQHLLLLHLLILLILLLLLLLYLLHLLLLYLLLLLLLPLLLLLLLLLYLLHLLLLYLLLLLLLLYLLHLLLLLLLLQLLLAPHQDLCAAECPALLLLVFALFVAQLHGLHHKHAAHRMVSPGSRCCCSCCPHSAYCLAGASAAHCSQPTCVCVCVCVCVWYKRGWGGE